MTSTAIITAGSLFALYAQAAGLEESSGLSATAGEAGLSTTTNLAGFVGSFITALIGVMGAIFVALLSYAGFLWMTAAGNEEKVKKAKGIIANTIIGVIVTFSAYAITTFVVNALSAAIGSKK